MLNYRARYKHRVAISNHRLLAFQNDRFSFRWKDYAHGGKQKIMMVSADEFLRLFPVHVLPKGLVRILHPRPLWRFRTAAYEHTATPALA
jgi:Putative transposase